MPKTGFAIVPPEAANAATLSDGEVAPNKRDDTAIRTATQTATNTSEALVKEYVLELELRLNFGIRKPRKQSIIRAPALYI